MTGLGSFSTFPRDRGMSLLGHISSDCDIMFTYYICLIVDGCISNTLRLQGGAYLKLGINAIISGIRWFLKLPRLVLQDIKNPTFRIPVPKITEPLPPQKTCPAPPVSVADMTASRALFVAVLCVVIQALLWSKAS